MYTKNITKSEIIDILNSNDEKLLKDADEVRKIYKGDFVHIRGLLEFTNTCKCNCKYCGLRCENKYVKRYRLNEKEIINNCNKKRLGSKNQTDVHKNQA